jgi:hypothetical protein
VCWPFANLSPCRKLGPETARHRKFGALAVLGLSYGLLAAIKVLPLKK